MYVQLPRFCIILSYHCLLIDTKSWFFPKPCEYNVERMEAVIY